MTEKKTEEKTEKKTIVIFASPRCTENPRLHKSYFNVAWFVRAYPDVLADYTKILTTRETMEAVEGAVIKDRAAPREPNGYWDVPADPNILADKAITEADRHGFDGQVWLMAAIVRGDVERVLMFMDPLDTKEYLPETYAFIRNCTLAEVGLHINLGATYWAESVRAERRTGTNAKLPGDPTGFGGWSLNAPRNQKPAFHSVLNPDEQMVHFIAHDSEKEKLSRFVYHYRQHLSERARTGWTFSGTFGTCSHIEKYLAHPFSRWESLALTPAGTGTTAHGPTGGDVVIADEVREKWPLDENKLENATDVRNKSLSHTILFFIDYYHARPHETDIHVLLRTCLNPHRGVHLILNERSAIEWGNTIRRGYFSRTEEHND